MSSFVSGVFVEVVATVVSETVVVGTFVVVTASVVSPTIVTEPQSSTGLRYDSPSLPLVAIITGSGLSFEPVKSIS